MTDKFEPPAGYEFMSEKAQTKARSVYRARTTQEENVARLGPRALSPAEGVYEPSAWEGPTPDRDWLVTGLIPLAQVAMITGNGGEGKSLIAAQLAVAAATGGMWLGRRVQRVKAMMIHCEDDELEMRRRINSIAAGEGMDFSHLDNLTLIDRDGAEGSLMYEAFGNDATGQFTAFYRQVYETVRSIGAQLLIMDSLYNFYGGNENIRSQVTDFIGGLKRIAKQLNCTIIVIAHPGRAGMGQGGDGTSGSTAWHNAVRSRYYLHRKRHASGDPDKQGPLIFESMKANYGVRVPPLALVWDAGRFVPVSDSAPSMPADPGQDQEDLWGLK